SIKSGDDRRLRKGGVNPALAQCKLAVTRVVRSDSAGATSVLKDYLVTVDPTLILPPPAPGARARSFGPDCGWPCYNISTTQRNWPGGTNTIPAAGDGSVAVALPGTPGPLGYGELPPPPTPRPPS